MLAVIMVLKQLIKSEGDLTCSDVVAKALECFALKFLQAIDAVLDSCLGECVTCHHCLHLGPTKACRTIFDLIGDDASQASTHM